MNAYITQDSATRDYVLVCQHEDGTMSRFALSIADAIRSQRSGVPYRANA